MPSQTSAAILLVEDEPQVLQLLRAILDRAGYHVLSARNGLEALRLYEQHGNAVDLLLVDASIPELEELINRRPSLKVLALSPCTTGQVPVLSKPFTPDALIRAIQILLGGPPRETP